MNEQLTKVVEALGITIFCQYGAVELPEDWDRDAHPYKCTLRLGKRRLTVPFFMGSAHTNEPTPADVLSCICSDARAGEQSFEEFCSEFGYDVDSRKAEKTWKTCASLAPRVRRFLGEHFDRVANAEH